jgi:ubiquitin thioesterase OTU1
MAAEAAAAAAAAAPAKPLALREMPDDNSCLYHAAAYVLENRSRDAAPLLRQIVASVIESDSDTYSDAVLGAPRADYLKRVLNPQAWGGAVELQALAQFYATEIAAIDVQTLHTYVYGEGKRFTERVYLVYNGIHYDALALPGNPRNPADHSKDTTRFAASDASAAQGALAVAAALRAKGKFVDQARFTLRCDVCALGVVGQVEAVEHAKASGHTAFSEYR